MADTNPLPPMTGKNVKVQLLSNGQPVPNIEQLARKYAIKEVATRFRDSYLNRNRKRPDKQIDGYDMDLEMDTANTTVIDFLLSRQALRDNNQPLPTLAVQLTFEHRVGTFSGLILSGIVEGLDDFSGDRDSRLVTKLKFEGEDLEAVAL